MSTLSKIELRKPYLLLVGDETEPADAKTGFGIIHWCPDTVAGQLRFNDAAVDLGVPDMTIEEAASNGVGSLVISTAPIGGMVPDKWWRVMGEAAEAGLDIVGGLHTRLGDNETLVAQAKAGGGHLVDIRIPPSDLPCGTGEKRSGKRILTVGTDCAVGKKYSALSMHAALKAAGFKTTFRATGQTGIMIAGEGIPIDCVVADFIAGAAEVLSPDNDADHWDVIEGQGSLFHPAYSGVSMGLLHGSQPDGIIVCHQAHRTQVSGWESFDLPTIAEVIEVNVRLASRTNPEARCIGICVNTSALDEHERAGYLDSLRSQHGVPAVDPLIDGCDAIVDEIK